MKKLPPYARQLKVAAPLNLVTVFIGAPDCWKAVKDNQRIGVFNGLVLPDIQNASAYNWPVSNCDVALIDFAYSDAQSLISFIQLLANAGATGATVRQIPNDEVIEYRFEREAA